MEIVKEWVSVCTQALISVDEDFISVYTSHKTVFLIKQLLTNFAKPHLRPSSLIAGVAKVFQTPLLC